METVLIRGFPGRFLLLQSHIELENLTTLESPQPWYHGRKNMSGEHCSERLCLQLLLVLRHVFSSYPASAVSDQSILKALLHWFKILFWYLVRTLIELFLQKSSAVVSWVSSQ